jgi:uridylate kinase
MVTNPDEILDIPETFDVVVAAGYRPGCSTDLRAIQIAQRVGAKKVINLSNIDYVYTADPKTNPEAKRIEDISWEEFRALIPKEWDPGLSSPFDPIAAKEAAELQIEVVIINGDKPQALADYLDGKEFIGTKIS